MNADEKKKELLKLAKKGGKRPSKKSHPLGQALSSYICKSSGCCDESFVKEIKKLAPHWFVTSISNANQKKKELLKLARKGGERPKRKDALGSVFSSYVNNSQTSYDASFAKEIKKIAPHWFVNQSDIANQKKEELLKLARKGGKRPNRATHPLGHAFVSYMNSSSDAYDESFTKEIKELAPHWFRRKYDPDAKKKELLDLAKKGGKRPMKLESPASRDNYSIIGHYTCSKDPSYDASFTEEIKKLAPHWFENRQSDIANKKKEELLELAKNGGERPKQKKNTLGQSLSRYTRNNNRSYDATFAKVIKKLAPHWFVTSTNSSKENKEELLKMARKGSAKPKWGTKLGNALVNYCGKSNSYDPVFEKEIKKIAPHWFKKG